MWTYTGEKPYAYGCPRCKKGFTSSAELKRHVNK